MPAIDRMALLEDLSTATASAASDLSAPEVQ